MGKIVVQQGQFYKACEISETRPLSIGRGFSNTLIVNDPYVAASQLRILAQGDSTDSWVCHNLDHTNALLHNRRRIENGAITLRSGDELTVGRSNLAFFSTDHGVDPTRSFSLSNGLQNSRFKPLLASLMLGLVFALSLLMTWLWTFDKPDWGQLSAMSATMPIMVLLWSAGWALCGRFLKHHHQFSAQLFFSAACVCLIILTSFFNSYVDYYFASTLAGQIFDWLTFIALVGLALGFNISLATHSSNAMRRGLVASVCLCGLSLLLLYLSQGDYSHTPEPSTSFKPAWVPSAKAVSVEDYIDDYDAIIEGLARQVNEN
jgi:hypothetical protein